MEVADCFESFEDCERVLEELLTCAEGRGIPLRL